MIQLQDIITLLSNGEEGTTNALLQTKVFLFSIGKKDLSSWIDHEINGYPSVKDAPEYRVVKARILGNLNNGYRHYNGLQLPVAYLNDKEYKDAHESVVTMSISQIEQLVINAGDNKNLQQHIPIDVARIKYCKSIEDSYEITSCYKEIALHSFTGILTQVRSRLLSFLLELSDQTAGMPEEKSMADKLSKVDTDSIFHSAIFGDNTVINLGHENSFTINNQVCKGDLSALKKSLTENGISETDVNALEAAIIADGPISPRSNTYGKNVSTWFSNVITKAANGTLGIGVTVATEVLTDGLKRYFGLQ
ncbi:MULTISPECIES: hypothetical protein [Leclercia]|uniref:AbiTii domain-containing protein n=1 Tax=Leclercia TaxID=83654 RepID=UPI0012E989F9|nr:MULTISPECIES: hypothetical protein [Leclercia]QGW18221.1 hypothetical protein GNG29_17380 [Leclercia sp. Colony189]URM21913.1 hypothetical protein JJN11_17610 [Leclercia adecarboxylata]